MRFQASDDCGLKRGSSAEPEGLGRSEASVEVASSEGESVSGEALPAGWAWASLPDLGELNRGKSRHRPRNAEHLYGGRYPFVQTGDIAQANGRIKSHSQTYSEAGLEQSRLWPEGTVAITIAANIASSAILTYPACFPDSVVGSLPEDKISSPMFVEYFIRTAREDLDRYAPSTAQKNINLGILKEVRVPLPPRAEQTRIVSAIESLQERSSRARDLLSEVGPLIGQLRQSVLRSAFSGQLTAKWRASNPVDEPASELLLRIRTERRERWEAEQLAKYEAKGKQPPKNWQDKYKEPEPVDESELPELPEGWCWAALEELTHRVTYGITVRPKYVQDSDAGIRSSQPKKFESTASKWTFRTLTQIAKIDFDGSPREMQDLPTRFAFQQNGNDWSRCSSEDRKSSLFIPKHCGDITVVKSAVQLEGSFFASFWRWFSNSTQSKN